MAESLVLELQRLASEGSCPVDELLRKALVVATKLKIEDFRKWVRAELDGYPDENVPEYRVVPTSLRAINRANGLHLPIMADESGPLDRFKRSPLGTAVGELVSLLQSDSEFFQIPLPDPIQHHLNRWCGMPIRMECYLRVSPTSVSGIVDAVRNTILEWSLQLESEGILGEGMSFSQEEKAIAQRSSSIHIENIANFQGVLGDVTSSTVTQNLQMTVSQWDLESLKRQLAGHGVTADDLATLETALQSDPTPTQADHFGPNVSDWIGSMLAKAASGTWNIAIGTAGQLLTQAIAAYYGLGG